MAEGRIARKRRPACRRRFDGAEAEWEQLLAAHAFRDPAAAFHLLKEFAEGPGYVHVSPRTTELARELIPKFLALCPQRRQVQSARRFHQVSKARKNSLGPAQAADLRRQMPAATTILSDPDRVLTRLDSFITRLRHALGAVGNLERQPGGV